MDQTRRIGGLRPASWGRSERRGGCLRRPSGAVDDSGDRGSRAEAGGREAHPRGGSANRSARFLPHAAASRRHSPLPARSRRLGRRSALVAGAGLLRPWPKYARLVESADPARPAVLDRAPFHWGGRDASGRGYRATNRTGRAARGAQGAWRCSRRGVDGSEPYRGGRAGSSGCTGQTVHPAAGRDPQGHFRDRQRPSGRRGSRPSIGQAGRHDYG